MKRTALILIITTAALVAAATASSQVRWQHPSKTEWFHKANLRIEHTINWTFSGTAGCLPRNSGTRIQVPVKGDGTVVLRGTPAASWPSIWRLEKSGYRGYRGIFGAPGLYEGGHNLRGGIIVKLTREESGQLTTDRSACQEPNLVEQVEPFEYYCHERARQGINLTYNQRFRYDRRIGRTVLYRGREHLNTMYVDDPELASSEPMEPLERACVIETKQPFRAIPWRSTKAMTYAWSERKTGRIEQPGSGTYAWTSRTSIDFGLSACRSKYSRGSWPEFKGCR